MGLRMQPRQSLTVFSKAGLNVAESAAILMEFVSGRYECWAELANRVHDIERAGDDDST